MRSSTLTKRRAALAAAAVLPFLPRPCGARSLGSSSGDGSATAVKLLVDKAPGNLQAAGNSGWETLDIRQVTFAGGGPVIAGQLGAANNHLLNRNSAKCADVWSLSTADGAAVNSGSCNSGANQQWVLAAVGSHYRVVNGNSGTCLQISGASTPTARWPSSRRAPGPRTSCGRGQR
ncbi:RICIN domain-containing protein [Streptomyces sp. NPDC057474]|uniref:RICIN domain-containing protein n=1 Tax=Streptomyces sp. NPDC057474 TaxID=3346144 RepID=UPI0036B74A90